MKTAFLYLYILELFILNIAVGWGYQGREAEEAESGALISNFCLTSHRWNDVGKLTELAVVM